VISKGSSVHGKVIPVEVKQNLASLSFANFGKKVELLAECTAGFNKNDSTGLNKSFASYVYAGYRVSEKFIPYIRYDNLEFQEGELYYHHDCGSKLLLGVRYQINYLAVVKLEYQRTRFDMSGNANKIIAQFAIGF
jgi:hypothetical protein